MCIIDSYYLCLFHMHPDSRAATRTRPDSYSPRAFVSSHSRKLAKTQQLAQSSWRNRSWVLYISTTIGCAENHYIGKMISQHYIVCDDDTWLSNYYHTVYMQLVHLCKDTWWLLKWLYLCYIRMFHVKHRTATARFLWRISCHPAVMNCHRYLYKQQ